MHGPTLPSREELKAIIDATPERWRPLILSAIFTGLRGSELRGLLWSDIDLKRGVLSARRRVDRFNSFGRPSRKPGLGTFRCHRLC